MTPEVLIHADTRLVHLLLESLVVEVPAPEAHVCGGLDDGTSGDVKVRVDVFAVSAAILTTHEDTRTLLAVADEDGTGGGTDDDLAVLAVVDHEAVAHVQNVDLAVLARVDDELLPVDGARSLDQLFTLSLEEDEILGVELGFGIQGRRGGSSSSSRLRGGSRSRVGLANILRGSRWLGGAVRHGVLFDVVVT